MGILERLRLMTETKRRGSAPNGLTTKHLLLDSEALRSHILAVPGNFLDCFPLGSTFSKPWAISWAYQSTPENLSDSSLNPDHPQDQALNFFSKTRWSRTFQFVRGYPLE